MQRGVDVENFVIDAYLVTRNYYCWVIYVTGRALCFFFPR